MLRRKIILIIALFALAGCARIQTDGDMISYSRFGSQKLTDLTFTKTARGDVTMTLGGQESTDLGKALGTLNKALDKIPQKP